MTEYQVVTKSHQPTGGLRREFAQIPGVGGGQTFKPSQALRDALNALTRFRQNNRSKTAPFIEIYIRRQMLLALQGNAMAAEILLVARPFFEVRRYKLTLVFDEADPAV